MFRKIVSLILLVSLVALSTSGILMIILGSFEFQLQMHPVHKIFGVLLAIAGALHLYMNFSAIRKYLGDKKLALFTLLLTALMVGLYAVGTAKPLDKEKIQQIENIMKTLES